MAASYIYIGCQEKPGDQEMYYKFIHHVQRSMGDRLINHSCPFLIFHVWTWLLVKKAEFLLQQMDGLLTSFTPETLTVNRRNRRSSPGKSERCKRTGNWVVQLGRWEKWHLYTKPVPMFRFCSIANNAVALKNILLLSSLKTVFDCCLLIVVAAVLVRATLAMLDKIQ